MEWLNIQLSQLRAPEYLGSNPVKRATWLQLLAYCADQENGGVIPACQEWEDRAWQQLCGITRKEAHTPSRLWSWDAATGSLTVWGYPVEKENLVRTRRATAAAGGRASGHARQPGKHEALAEANASPPASSKREANASPHASPSAEPNPQANGQAPVEQKLERNRKGIGKEGEEERKGSTTTTTTPPPGAPQAMASPAPSQATSPASPPDAATAGEDLQRGCTLAQAQAYAATFNAGAGLTQGHQISPQALLLWHDDRSACGWVKTRDGHEHPIADWQADLRLYSRRYTANERAPAPGSRPAAGPGHTPAPTPTTQPQKAGW